MHKKIGVVRSFISGIELGKKKLTINLAQKLSPILKVSPHELLGEDAIKYKGTFYESTNALLDANFDTMVKKAMVDEEPDEQLLIFWIIYEVVKRKISHDDLKAIHSVVDSIAKKDLNK